MPVRPASFQGSPRARAGAVALGYLAIGLAVYWPALGAPLVSDDYYFLGIVGPAASVLVMFEPLLDRFWRPLVVAMYYVSYHGWGLWPWPYHLLTLLPHVLTAWLLYLALELIEAGVWWRAALAGLVFLVFGGHSEAVAFPGGLGDPAAAAAIMAAFVCYLRVLQPGSGAGWLAAFAGAVCAAALTKEVWVVLPGILVAHLVAFGLPPAAVRRRAAVVLGGTVLAVLAYLLMRRVVFGTVAGGYGVLSQSFAEGAWPAQVRAFMLRCFAPAGHYVANLWLSGRDVLIWPAAAVLLGVAARGHTLRVLVFSAAAAFVALLPVLPLSISVSNTESERYVYVATVFSSIFVVWGLQAVLRRRALVIASGLLIAAAHAVSLVGFNQRWYEAGALADRIVHGVADQARAHAADGRTAIVLLGLPDNITGPFVFRVGFYPALRLNRPEVAHLTAPAVVVTTMTLREPADEVRVERIGPRGFRVDFGRNRIVPSAVPGTVHFTIREQTPTSYSLEFGESVDRALVLYVSGGAVRVAGLVEGEGRPFGAVDLPADPVSCEGTSARFAGWALDGDGLPRVRLIEAGTGRELGVADRRAGMRPDVAALYPAYPGVDRAGWDFEFPCGTAGRGAVRVQVVVEDAHGLRQVIGTRTVSGR